MHIIHVFYGIFNLTKHLLHALHTLCLSAKPAFFRWRDYCNCLVQEELSLADSWYTGVLASRGQTLFTQARAFIDLGHARLGTYVYITYSFKISMLMHYIMMMLSKRTYVHNLISSYVSIEYFANSYNCH